MRHILFFTLLLSPGSIRADDAKPSSEERIKALEDRLNKLEGAPAKTSLSAFNPAMGLALDFAVTHDRSNRSSFLFRTAELNLEAAVDPFAKGFAIINGNASGVEVEEAALQTTALPWNLQLTGGRLFASFGRLPHFHDHELPVINRPSSIDTFIGGESQADGVEASYLFPTPFYLNATAGLFNKIGGENGRAANAVNRPLDEFTYLARLAAYADMGDDHSLELGLSNAWTPKRTVQDTRLPGTDFNGDGTPDTPNVSANIFTRHDTWRTLSGVDLTYRYQPAAGGIYKGAVWGTEVLANNEQRFDPVQNTPMGRVQSYAGYSYLWLKLGRHWRPGFMIDLTQSMDNHRQVTRTYTPFLTYDLTEFQRLRLAWSETVSNTPGVPLARVIALQWTGVLGRHAHGFRDR